jgi:surfeit locus 1 family protein
MSIRLRPGLVVATLIALAILCSLGSWQLKRLEWKRGLIAQMTERLTADPIAFDEALAREAAGANMEYQPVFVEGVFAHDLETMVFGTLGGQPGVYVFTPLDAADPTTDGRRFIYVNRGFAPQDFRDPATRADGQVSGGVRVEGLLRHAERKRGFEKWLAPDNQPADNLYFVRDPLVLAARHSIGVPSVYIDSFKQQGESPWPKGGVTRIDIPNRHFEYALTWFGLAAALLGVFIAFSLKPD